jgi:hypothetical protein
MEQTDPSDVIKDLGQAVLMQILKDRFQRDNVIFKTK